MGIDSELSQIDGGIYANSQKPSWGTPKRHLTQAGIPKKLIRHRKIVAENCKKGEFALVENPDCKRAYRIGRNGLRTQRGLRRISTQSRHFLTIFSSGIIGTGKMANRQRKWPGGR